MKKAILVLMILTSCGGDDGGWDDQARTDFIAGCTDAGSPEDVCKCLQEKLEEANPDLETPEDIDQAQVAEFTRECIE
jgi:hypothetical protein